MERISQQAFYALQPVIPQALLSLNKAALESGLEVRLIHLVKIRASQINGCGFCLHMHHKEARKDGEIQERLDTLSAWRELPYFSEREKAALLWTESLTDIINQTVSNQSYEIVSLQFDESEIVNLTAIVLEINSWNRIVAAMKFVPNIKE